MFMKILFLIFVCFSATANIDLNAEQKVRTQLNIKIKQFEYPMPEPLQTTQIELPQESNQRPRIQEKSI